MTNEEIYTTILREMKEDGWELKKIRPHIFVRDDEIVVTNKTSLVSEYRKTHKRQKNRCKDCGCEITEVNTSMGAKRCRCENCFKRFVRQSKMAGIVIKSRNKAILDSLKVKWNLTTYDAVVEALLKKEA
jgi:hypothetical protein